MNDTNRAVNRGILLTVGLLLLGASGTALLALAWPEVGGAWTAGITAATDWLRQAEQSTRVTDATTLSWLLLAMLAALLLLLVLAVTVVARLGGGRSTVVIRAEAADGPNGPVTVRTRFAADAITHALERRDEILSSRVRSRRVRGASVLHVSVTPRPGTPPAEVAATVSRVIDNLATLLGQEVASYLSIHAGLQARFAADRSRVQ